MENTMHLKAYAKINWALNVLGTREDGYHLLDMLVQRLMLHDELVLSTSDRIDLELTGNEDMGSLEKNLAYRAAMALQQAASIDQGVKIVLTKHIPAQAGLGGGSADAAAVLLGLNQFWNLRWSVDDLAQLGQHLGADVPLCLYEGLMRVQGIGERVQPIKGASSLPLLILRPQGGLSTKTVFERFDALAAKKVQASIDQAITALANNDLASLPSVCKNQLQEVAVGLLPSISEAIKALHGKGASFSMMSGAGSSVFGVFSSDADAANAYQALKPDWPICILTKTQADID